MFECIVNADLFRRALTCASTEATRYYLHGVQIEPCPDGGALLIATDGHVMIVLRDPDAHVQGSAIVHPTMILKSLTAKMPRGYSHRFLAARDGAAVLVNGLAADGPGALDNLTAPTGAVESFQPAGALIDGSFPPWRRVIPGAGGETPVAFEDTFNADLALRLAKALCDGKTPMLRVQGYGKGHAGLVRGCGSIQGFGVLMPCRDSEGPLTTAPTWARQTAA